MATQDAQFRMRMPHDLREFIRDSAKRNERSLNGEMVFILRQHQKSASEHTA